MNEELAPYETLEVWPPETELFHEATPVTKLIVVHSGEVELRVAAPKGDERTMFVAGPGEILGLSCVVGNRPHDCSATTKTTCITGSIEKNEFLKLLDGNPNLWLGVLRTISSNINACWDCMRALR